MGCGDELAERRSIAGQRRIAGIDIGAGPAHRGGGLNRCFEIVAERGAKRSLIALLDCELIDHGRPEVFRLDVQELGECLGLGVEPLRAALGFGERLARHVESLTRRRMRDLRA
jgi:hypothetical protein